MYHGSMQSGGQGIYLSQVTRELSRLGHRVHVISGPPYATLDPSVYEHRIVTYSFQSMLLDRGAYFARPPLSYLHPLNLYEFASTRFTFSSLIATFSLRALAELRRLEEIHGPFDIVHDNQTLSYGTHLARAVLRKRVVANIHHPLDVDLRNGLRELTTVRERVQRIAWYPWMMQRVVANRLDALISGSKASARLAERLWSLRAGLMHPIYDGVDTDVFRPGAEDETEPGTVLFVGNSDDFNKGVIYAIRAMALLPPSTRAHLWIVGGPSADVRVAPAEARRCGVEDRLTIVGRVSQDELARWYRRAQITVSPSLYEGFGLPAAESMSCGTPVLASDGGALPEVVEDGVTGVVVPARGHEALAGAMARMLGDPALCRAMGEAGRRRVLERFTWRRTAEETAALYGAVLSGP